MFKSLLLLTLLVAIGVNGQYKTPPKHGSSHHGGGKPPVRGGSGAIHFPSSGGGSHGGSHGGSGGYKTPSSGGGSHGGSGGYKNPSSGGGSHGGSHGGSGGYKTPVIHPSKTSTSKHCKEIREEKVRYATKTSKVTTYVYSTITTKVPSYYPSTYTATSYYTVTETNCHAKKPSGGYNGR